MKMDEVVKEMNKVQGLLGQWERQLERMLGEIQELKHKIINAQSVAENWRFYAEEVDGVDVVLKQEEK